MPIEVSFSDCAQSRPAAEAVERALSDAGILACSLLSPAPAAHRIVLFDRCTDCVVDAVRTLVRQSDARVLAIQCACDAENDDAWCLLQAGADDVIEWGNDPIVIGSITERLLRWQDIETCLQAPVVRNNLVGSSRRWRGVLRQVIEAARFTRSSLLITGESGTGKELIARLIHTLDTRARKGELVTLDCTTIVPELSGSELFGHERGAFTGAVGSRDGAFAMADGGTLFLDEIGELAPALQAQLLRVIQEKTYKRVGGNQWMKTDFRLICATNRNLIAEVGSGVFRGDLFYRIASWTCDLPPLRERREDILPLAEHFLGHDAAGSSAIPNPTAVLSNAVSDHLLRREWPGNVRELRQMMAQVQARHVGTGPITLGDLPREEMMDHAASAQAWCDEEFERAIHQAVCRGVKLKELSQQATEIAVRMVVDQEAGNLQRAAKRLGVTDRALQLRRASQPLRVTN